MKPRILILITLHMGIRYLVHTGLLKKISEFSQPVLLLSWFDAELWKSLVDIGCEVHVLPQNVYGPRYKSIRRKLDIWHFYYRVKSVSLGIDKRRFELSTPWLNLLIRRLRTWKSLIELVVPGAISRMLATENKLVITDTNISESLALLRQLKPDAVFSLTPFHAEEDLFLRAATLEKIPTIASILSFDNPTTRGWIPIIFDQYLVWNHYNKAELLRIYPSVKPDQIEIVGPVQFDLYKNTHYLWPEDDWRARLELPKFRPVILYAGSSDSVIAHESNLVKELDLAITNGELPQNPLILLRLHPTDTNERWQRLLASTKNVILDENFNPKNITEKNKYRGIVKYANYTDDDIKRQVSTFQYTQVHISVCSTISLDGAMFDKPQISLAFNSLTSKKQTRCLHELYQKEHYLPIVRSGGVEIVFDHDQMIAAVANALMTPEKRSIQRQNMVHDLATFTDGQSAQRATAAIYNFLNAQR